MTILIQKIQDEIQYLETEIKATDAILSNEGDNETIKTAYSYQRKVIEGKIKGLMKALIFIKQENEKAFNQLKEY